MTVSDFDDESNLLEIEGIPHEPLQVKRMYLIILIIVLTATAAFAFGILAQRGSSVTGASAAGNTGSGGLTGAGAGSSLNSLTVSPQSSH